MRNFLRKKKCELKIKKCLTVFLSEGLRGVFLFKRDCRLDEGGSRRIQVAGFCEHRNEPSG